MLIQLMKQVKIATLLVTLLTLLTGLIYPCIVTGISQTFFPWQANGSLLEDHGKIIGSYLIGQSFTDPAYFWGRPSATLPFPYNAAYSSGSNQGPNNPDFLLTVKKRISSLQAADKNNFLLVPIDLVTASGSGLDPDISPEAAFYQVSRIAKIRQVPSQKIIAIINQFTQQRWLKIAGEPRVNVLQLNIALLQLSQINDHRNAHERSSS